MGRSANYDYTEADLQQAIREYETTKNARAVGQKYKIPRTTIISRYNRVDSKKEGCDHLQRLSREEEGQIAEWIKEQDGSWSRPSRKEVIDFAVCVLCEKGDDKPLGRHWIEQFLRRNPSARKHTRRKMTERTCQ